jgi:hypothetical protein
VLPFNSYLVPTDRDPGRPVHAWNIFSRTVSASRTSSIFTHFAPDVLGYLVRLSEQDRPPGIQAEVLRAVQNMVVLLDEQFLVHSAVHRAVLRLLRTCVGDDIQEQLDGKKRRIMGAAGTAVRAPPSEHEEDRMFIHKITPI